MAMAHEHKRQAQHNQECLDTIDTNRFPDWAATVAFYKAVHLVEMLFVTKALANLSGSHVKRNNLLKKKYPKIWMGYRPLYAFSRTARYWCLRVKPEHWPYLLKRLGKVQMEVESAL
jgi:hypothetical protein